MADRNRTERHPNSRNGRPNTDRWDRRFRLEGDAVEAIRAVLADRAQKTS